MFLENINVKRFIVYANDIMTVYRSRKLRNALLIKLLDILWKLDFDAANTRAQQ